MFSPTSTTWIRCLLAVALGVASSACVAEQVGSAPFVADEDAGVSDVDAGTDSDPGIHLHVTEDTVRVVDGQEAALEVDVTRTDFEGAINIEVEDLPRGVYATNISIPATSSHGRIHFTTAPPIAFGGRVAFHLRAASTDLAARADLRVFMTVAGAPGTLDESYSYDGLASHRVGRYEGGTDAVTACAIDRYGSVTIAGTTQVTNARNEAFAVRVLRDGTLDPHFGSNGTVIGLPELGATSSMYTGLSVAEDGSVLLLASATYATGSHERLVARRMPEGAIDTRFGSLGFIRGISQDTTWLSAHAEGFLLGNESIEAFTNTGARDESFAGGALTDLPFGRGPSFVDSEGRLLVVGADKGKVGVARFLSSGTLDTRFGSSGAAFMVLPEAQTDVTVRGIATQSDGGVIVVGMRRGAGGDRGLMIRFTAEGLLDASFAGGGVAVMGEDTGSLMRVIVDGEDRILVSGNSDPSGMSEEQYIARFNPDGSADASFGEEGIVRDVQVTGMRSMFIDDEAERIYVCGAAGGGVTIGRFWN